MTIHPQKDLVLTADSKGRMDQWYILSQNETPADVLQEMTRGNEQGIAIDSLEQLKQSPLQTRELTHPVLFE